MKVALAKCSTYGPGLRQALEELLAELGGIDEFIRPGQSVLIKPNLLSDKEPARAVTTHPEVVRALVRLVREHGATPSVGDSPASAVKLERVWERTGFAAMCAEENVPLLNFESAGSVHFDGSAYSFSIAKPVIEADAIISVPKVKTHVLTTFTCAVKNMYGVLPGYQKAQLHKKLPRPGDIAPLMLEICRTAPPTLSIADGIVGMQGDGPSSGEPVEMGFLAASSDPVALDLTLCELLGIKVRAVPYLRNCLESERESIEVVGAPREEVRVSGFRPPGTLRARLIPRGMVKILGPFLWIRPEISDRCTSCGRCVECCPVDALAMGTAGEKPDLTPNRCLGCCCCHEVCPAGAISMVQSPVLRLIRGRDLK